jgi:hypothetical protein
VARKEELEAVLSSNLRRRRDELRQALAEADAGAARCAGARRWQPASLMPPLLWHDTGLCGTGWRCFTSHEKGAPLLSAVGATAC